MRTVNTYDEVMQANLQESIRFHQLAQKLALQGEMIASEVARCKAADYLSIYESLMKITEKVTQE